MQNEKLGECIFSKCVYNNNYKCRYAASRVEQIILIPCIRYVEIEIEKSNMEENKSTSLKENFTCMRNLVLCEP